MKTQDLRTKTTNPNAEEISKLMIDRLNKNCDILALESRLIIAQSQLAEIEQTLEYLGGRCKTCGEFGNIVLDPTGFCQFCQ